MKRKMYDVTKKFLMQETWEFNLEGFIFWASEFCFLGINHCHSTTHPMIWPLSYAGGGLERATDVMNCPSGSDVGGCGEGCQASERLVGIFKYRRQLCSSFGRYHYFLCYVWSAKCLTVSVVKSRNLRPSILRAGLNVRSEGAVCPVRPELGLISAVLRWVHTAGGQNLWMWYGQCSTPDTQMISFLLISRVVWQPRCHQKEKELFHTFLRM